MTDNFKYITHYMGRKFAMHTQFRGD